MEIPIAVDTVNQQELRGIFKHSSILILTPFLMTFSSGPFPICKLPVNRVINPLAKLFGRLNAKNTFQIKVFTNVILIKIILPRVLVGFHWGKRSIRLLKTDLL